MNALLRHPAVQIPHPDLVTDIIPDDGAHPVRPDQDPHVLTKGLFPLLAVLPDERGIHLVTVVLFGKPHPPHLHVRLLHPQFDYDPIHVVSPLCAHRHDHLHLPIHLHLHHKLGTLRTMMTMPGNMIHLTPRHQNGRNLHPDTVQIVNPPRPQIGNPRDIIIIRIHMALMTGLGTTLHLDPVVLTLRPNRFTSMQPRPENLSQHFLFNTAPIPKRCIAVPNLLLNTPNHLHHRTTPNVQNQLLHLPLEMAPNSKRVSCTWTTLPVMTISGRRW